MYFCPLVPIPHLEQLGKCWMSLVLSHLVGDGNNNYTEFYHSLSKTGTYTILGSGAYEAWLNNQPLPTLDETLRRAELIGANEIQFPEKFWNGKGTIELVLSWIKSMDKKIRKKYAWHAVLQGKDQQDYMDCFNELERLEEVHIIGIPKIVTPHCFTATCGTNDLVTTRIFVVAQLIPKTNKCFHLAGLENPREVISQCKWGKHVRSVDSSFPVIHAIHGICYSPDIYNFSVDFPRFDFYKKLSKNILKRAKYNLETIRVWCGETEQ